MTVYTKLQKKPNKYKKLKKMYIRDNENIDLFSLTSKPEERQARIIVIPLT